MPRNHHWPTPPAASQGYRHPATLGCRRARRPGSSPIAHDEMQLASRAMEEEVVSSHHCV
jgi:hypothetical protein